MANDFFDFSGSPWYRISNLAFYDDVICTTDNSKLEEYDPFYYYNNPLPDDIVSDILGQELGKKQPMFIHTLFLSLDPSNMDQIRKWILHFGLLDPFDTSEDVYPGEIRIYKDFGEVHYGYLDEISYDRDKDTPIFFIGTISGYIETMQAIVAVLQYVKTEYQVINESLFFFFDHFYWFWDDNHKMNYQEREGISSRKYWEDEKISQLDDNVHERKNYILEQLRCKRPKEIKHLLNIVKYYFDYHFSMIHPAHSITNLGLPTFKWKYDSLIGLILFLMYLDISANKFPLKCNAKNCNRYFVPTRKDVVYCSETCKNRARQQRHRAKIKQTSE